MKRVFLPPLLGGLLLGATACSTEAWYEGFRQRAENECNRMASGEREACLARINRQSYEAYEKERAAHRP